MLGGLFDLPPLHGLIQGDAEAVGARYIPPTPTCPPLRIFYPAKRPLDTNQRACCRWFHQDPGCKNNSIGVGTFLSGYLHVIGVKHGTLAFSLLSPIVHLVAWLLPMQYRRLPDTYPNLDVDTTACTTTTTTNNKKNRLPVIVFSHGLTGTSHENALLCAAWARQGYLVAAVHHTDGSSVCVPIVQSPKKQSSNNHSNEKDTTSIFTTLWYRHGPPLNKDYDPTFRKGQVLQRAQELHSALSFLKTCPTFAEHCNFEKVIGAGFSFGATTAILAAVLPPEESPSPSLHLHPSFSGLMLLDGWFYIDLAASAGMEFEFPTQAFEDAGLRKIHSIPSLFFNSESFSKYPKGMEATQKLAGMDTGHKDYNIFQRQQNHVIIPGTKHNNFCEISFWFPPKLLALAGTLLGGPVDVGAVGAVDPVVAYKDIIQRTSQFVRQVVS